MARPTDGPTARDCTISVRCTTVESSLLDQNRGAASRSDYLRRLIINDTRPEPKQPVAP